MQPTVRISFIMALAVLCFIALAPSVVAQNLSSVPPKSVREFLTSGGRFDLEKARLSGFEGSVSMERFSSGIDPTTRRLVFRAEGKTAGRNPDDVYWDNCMSSSIPGIDGAVSALAVYNGRLLAGGKFAIAGGVLANNIAVWDGISWSPIGNGMTGNDASVNAFAIYQGNLIAGGWFSSADTVSVRNIAAWDGTAWSPIGEGTNNGIYALLAYDTRLIAGGYFTEAGRITADCIAAWDGSTWSALGGSMNGPLYSTGVFALTVFMGKLIAGGNFTSAGGLPADKIAAWDGTSWSALGGGISGDNDAFVRALTIFQDKLIVGRELPFNSGMSNTIAVWDGNTWSSLGEELKGTVGALTVFDGKLVAEGIFSVAGGDSVNNIAAWNGTTWSPLGEGVEKASIMYARSFALAVFNNHLIAGGEFSTAGGESASRIAVWDGNSWSSLGSGLGGGEIDFADVYALTVYEGKLVAGGDFTGFNGASFNHIAAWNGFTWSPVGSGLDGTVSSLTVYNGDLIAGGRFTTAGGVIVNNIASWNGTKWSPLGEGRGDDMTRISALTVYEGKLVSGGWWFGGEVSAWDGSSWFRLGSGVGGSYLDVHALTVYNGKLFAGGRFPGAIAVWDGSVWSLPGGGMRAESDGYGGDTSFVLSLAEYDGKLAAGGWFFSAGGVPATCIAAWDGSSWFPLGLGVNHIVYDLTVYDATLIAGGSFAYANNELAIHIAAWNGSTWLPLGSGAGGGTSDYDEVLALTVYNNALIAGGSFKIAGSKVAPYIAMWTKSAPAAVSESSSFPSALCLSSVFPNPFNLSTTITISLPTPSKTELSVYSVSGQKVRTLVLDRLNAGTHSVIWDGTDDRGVPVSSGVYMARLEAGKAGKTAKMLLMK